MGLSTLPAVCHCTRSVSACQRVIPEVSVIPWMFPGGFRGPRCHEGQDIVPLCQMAQNPQDCTYGVAFICNDDICVLFLSCDSLLAVFVTINCFKVLSLLVVLDSVLLWKTICKVSVWHFYNCTFMNHTVA